MTFARTMRIDMSIGIVYTTLLVTLLTQILGSKWHFLCYTYSHYIAWYTMPQMSARESLFTHVARRGEEYYCLQSVACHMHIYARKQTMLQRLIKKQSIVETAVCVSIWSSRVNYHVSCDCDVVSPVPTRTYWHWCSHYIRVWLRQDIALYYYTVTVWTTAVITIK